MGLEKVINFVGHVPLVGWAMRRYARLYLEGSVITIAHGHLAGWRWKRYHRYVNGYWLGHYELPIQAALARELSPGQTFFDLGANAGFFTLLAAKCVGAKGQCVAFDPSPENAISITAQIELNHLTQCRVVQECVHAQEGEASFSFETAGSPMGHLGAKREGESSIQVKQTTLDAAYRVYGAPNFIKMDIEGAEVAALEGARELLQTCHPAWLIELHGAECAEGVRRILSGHGYSFFSLDAKALAADAVLPQHIIARR